MLSFRQDHGHDVSANSDMVQLARVNLVKDTRYFRNPSSGDILDFYAGYTERKGNDRNSSIANDNNTTVILQSGQQMRRVVAYIVAG